MPEVPTVAAAVLLLLQLPPPPSYIVVVVPSQRVFGPLMGAGCGSTVTTIEVVHPTRLVYVTITVLTPETLPPVTTPEVILIDATEALLLLHVPPVAAILKAVVAPPHIIAVPVMGADNVVTVTTVVAVQPAGNV